MKFLVAFLFAYTTTASLADQLYITVGVECNIKKSELEVWFRGAWDEDGEKSIANLGKNSWYTQNLVYFSQNTEGIYSIHKRTETRTCWISSDKYTISISPEVSPKFQPEGWCATRIGAMARIVLNQKVVAKGDIDGCTETGMVTTSIIVKPHQAPIFKKQKAEVFYGDN